MKLFFNKPEFLRFLFIFAVVSIILYSSSCKKDDSSGSDKQTISAVVYSGEVKITQDSLEIKDNMDFSFDEGSSTNGTFFRKSDGAVGVFTGSVSGSAISISGSMQNEPSSVFSGTIQISNNTLIVNLTGNDNTGNYSCTGTLNQEDCIDLAGTYYAQEAATFTITMNGQNETQTQSGYGTVVFEQANCQISYSVPGTSTSRTGDIRGSKLTFSGQFVIPASQDVILTENTFKGEVEITDNYRFSFTGTGKAKGTYQGSKFTITGTSTGEFDRQFKVAAAFLHGGPSWFPTGKWNAGDKLGILCTQAATVDPHNVIVKGFSANTSPSQLEKVSSWYYSLNPNAYSPNLVMVGHSTGADVVANSPDIYAYSRIAIDPWSSSEGSLNQRPLSLYGSSVWGEFYNILASTTDVLSGFEDPQGLLGYRQAYLSGYSNEWVEDTPPTNHFSIIQRVFEKNYVKNEITDALNGNKSSEVPKNTLKNVCLIKPYIKGEQPFTINFGWNNDGKK